MNRQAYARLLARLGGEHDEDHPPRSRSPSNSSLNSALPTVLRLLAQETARADAAEQELNRDSEALLKRVREIKEAKERMELELMRVKEELKLYKLQLTVAQNEINRAQKIVAEVNRAHVAAEERSVRDRDRLRKLVAQRAAEIAREEGRNEGWKQGLERGRLVALADWKRQRREYEDDEDAEQERSPTPGPAQRPSAPERSSAGQRERAASIDSNTASHAEIIPVRPRSASQRSIPIPVPIPTPSRPPENISIQQETYSGAQAPVSVRTPPRSPSVASRRSRRSIPPEGYIPTVGADSFISLPPPFELSRSVGVGPQPVEQASVARSAGASKQTESERKDLDRQGERGSQKESRAQDYVYQPVSGVQPPTYDDTFRDKGKSRGTPAMSTVSSQYDLLRSPQDPNGDRERRRYEANVSDRGRASGRVYDRQTGATSSGVNERVKEWRAASPVVVSPAATQTQAYLQRPTSAKSSIYSMSRGDEHHIEDALSRPQTSNPQRIYSPRVEGGPRLPRETNVATPTSPSRGRGNGTSHYIYRASEETTSPQQFHIPQPHSSSPPAENSNQHRLSAQSRPQEKLERSISNTTVPGIDIETPSHSSANSSVKILGPVDPLLLTPDHTPAPLLDDTSSGSHETQSTIYSSAQHPNEDGDTATIVLPDNDLPPGFMPLSPIPSIPNFKADEHDPYWYQRGIYQAYNAQPVIPYTADMGMGMGSGMPFSSSLLFAEPPHSSTAAGTSNTSTTEDNSNKGRVNFGTSPAPLDRPISLFSDTSG